MTIVPAAPHPDPVPATTTLAEICTQRGGFNYRELGRSTAVLDTGDHLPGPEMIDRLHTAVLTFALTTLCRDADGTTQYTAHPDRIVEVAAAIRDKHADQRGYHNLMHALAMMGDDDSPLTAAVGRLTPSDLASQTPQECAQRLEQHLRDVCTEREQQPSAVHATLHTSAHHALAANTHDIYQKGDVLVVRVTDSGISLTDAPGGNAVAHLHASDPALAGASPERLSNHLTHQLLEYVGIPRDTGVGGRVHLDQETLGLGTEHFFGNNRLDQLEQAITRLAAVQYGLLEPDAPLELGQIIPLQAQLLEDHGYDVRASIRQAVPFIRRDIKAFLPDPADHDGFDRFDGSAHETTVGSAGVAYEDKHAYLRQMDAHGVDMHGTVMADLQGCVGSFRLAGLMAQGNGAFPLVYAPDPDLTMEFPASGNGEYAYYWAKHAATLALQAQESGAENAPLPNTGTPTERVAACKAYIRQHAPDGEATLAALETALDDKLRDHAMQAAREGADADNRAAHQSAVLMQHTNGARVLAMGLALEAWQAAAQQRGEATAPPLPMAEAVRLFPPELLADMPPSGDAIDARVMNQLRHHSTVVGYTRDGDPIRKGTPLDGLASALVDALPQDTMLRAAAAVSQDLKTPHPTHLRATLDDPSTPLHTTFRTMINCAHHAQQRAATPPQHTLPTDATLRLLMHAPQKEVPPL